MSRLLQVVAASAVLTTARGSFIIEFFGTGKCLDLPGGNTDNGNLLQIWDCNGSPNQEWDFTPGTWQIRPTKNGKKCVDAAGGVKGGNKLQIWDCNGHDNQVWGYDGNSKTIYAAKSALSSSNETRPLASTCVDLPGGNTDNGKVLQVWSCNGLSNQKWLLTVHSGEYCPAASDLGFDYNDGGGKIFDQGWTIKGGARVHSRAAFNLLGGHIEFDLDVSKARVGVSNSLYTISPSLGGKPYDFASQYCNGQGSGGKFCMELDIIMGNGYCGGMTTIHTWMGQGGGCDQNGCQSSYHFSKTKFHVRAVWLDNGQMVTYIDSQTIYPATLRPVPDAKAWSVMAAFMRNQGAVIQSAQWSGWVPLRECGTVGDLGSSTITISNLRIKGTVVQGPAPRMCSSRRESNTTTVVV